MSVPKRRRNAFIVKITRSHKGFGGDKGTPTTIYRDMVANRQPAEQIRESGGGEHAVRADTEFFIDLPEPNPFLLKIGDVVTWRRWDRSRGAFGQEFEGAEIQLIDVQDHPGKLSHVRFQTRGGDGSGS